MTRDSHTGSDPPGASSARRRAEYQAAPGREDRHGEMTGAITINMILVFPLLTVWCVFIGPDLVGVGATIIIGLVLALLLTILGLPISRWIWAWFSSFADRY